MSKSSDSTVLMDSHDTSSATPTSRLPRLFDRPYLLLVLAVLFWSGNFIIGRAVHMAVPPVGLAFWRWSGGTMIVLGFAWPHLKHDWPQIMRHLPILLVLSLLGVATFNTLVYTGLGFTTAISGLLMQSTMPIIIMALSYLLFREAITRRQALGVVLSLAGALTIIMRGDWAVLRTLALNIGDVLIFIAVVSYAGYSVLLRKRPALHPLSFLAVTFATGTVMLLPLYIWEHMAGLPMLLNRTTLLAVGYVAIFPSILSYLCYNRGVELVGANRAGLFIHLLPVFGSLMAMLFLGETFQYFHSVGIALILSGIFLATRSRPATG